MKTKHSAIVTFAPSLILGAILLCLSLYIANTPTERLVRVLMTLPQVGVWVLAFLSAVCLKRYVGVIKPHADGKALNTIANGLLLITVYIVLLAFRHVIPSLFVGTPYLDLVVILRNHIPPIVFLAASILLLRGTWQLRRLANGRLWNKWQFVIFYALCVSCFGTFAVIFARLEPGAQPVDGVPRFVLPLQVLLFTYVLPYIAASMMVLVSCTNLAFYASNVSGKLYRRLFRNLYIGLLCIMASVFVVQLGTVSRFAGVRTFGAGFALAYAIFGLIAIGFTALYRGVASLALVERA